MILGIVVWLLLLLVSYLLIQKLKEDHPGLSRRIMFTLFFYHTGLAVTYYVYALFNPSDSIYYYQKAVSKFYGDNWFDYFGSSTRFIDFLTFPLVNYFGFTYEACMVFFSWLGFLGFIFFYIFFSEHIKTNVKIFGRPAIYFLLLLPNCHFWSASMGKGSIIFLGFGLFFYALNLPVGRIWALVLGGLIIFQIRPHIFYVLIIAVAVGYIFSTKGIGLGYRLIVLSVAFFLLYYIYDDIVTVTGLEDESIWDPDFSHRASELSKATSGIDIANYSIPEKLFAFWFRPLFFDATGILGIIVSFENAFYLFFFLRLLQPRAIVFLFTSDAIVKTSFFTFLGVSFALAQITGNLGLAMRQKSQVMLLILFVILRFMDEQKVKQLNEWMKRKQRHDLLLRRKEKLARA